MLRGLLQRLHPKQPIAEVDHDQRLAAHLFPEAEELIVSEAIGDGLPAVSCRHGPAALPPRHVVDEIAPVDVVHIGPAREADDGNLHLSQAFQDTGLKLPGPRDERALGAGLSPARPLHELPEQAVVHAPHNPVRNAYPDLIGGRGAGAAP